MLVCQKVPKLYFQSKFLKSKMDGFFFHLRIPIEKTIFWYKNYFLASIFEPLYFLELCPIFDELIEGFFLNFFLLV